MIRRGKFHRRLRHSQRAFASVPQRPAWKPWQWRYLRSLRNRALPQSKANGVPVLGLRQGHESGMRDADAPCTQILEYVKSMQEIFPTFYETARRVQSPGLPKDFGVSGGCSRPWVCEGRGHLSGLWSWACAPCAGGETENELWCLLDVRLGGAQPLGLGACGVQGVDGFCQ